MSNTAVETKTTTVTPATAPRSLHIEKPAQQQQAEAETSSLASIATGGYPFPGVPKFDDPYKKRQWCLEHMAGAFRVFARKGFTEGTAGHISVRDPVNPSTFWINP